MSGANETMELATIEDVTRIKAKVKDEWSLCQFFEGRRRALEAERIVLQTIHAAAINFKIQGEPFLFQDDCPHGQGGGFIVANDYAYDWLLSDGFFVEDERDGKVVIFMTKKLIERLDAHFDRTEKAVTP